MENLKTGVAYYYVYYMCKARDIWAGRPQKHYAPAPAQYVHRPAQTELSFPIIVFFKIPVTVKTVHTFWTTILVVLTPKSTWERLELFKFGILMYFILFWVFGQFYPASSMILPYLLKHVQVKRLVPKKIATFCQVSLFPFVGSKSILIHLCIVFCVFFERLTSSYILAFVIFKSVNKLKGYAPSSPYILIGSTNPCP